MRNRLFLMILLAALAFSAGCSRRPAFLGGQKELTSASQWNVLANDVANRINNELMRQKYLTASVHVRHSCGKPNACGPGETFPFDEGFNDLLTTQLVSFGVNTVVGPESANLLVEYKVQVLYHPASDPLLSWPKPGVMTALAAGIMVLRDAPWEVVAASGAIDLYRANARESGQYEVIVSTSIVDKKRYVMRSSDIYYIQNADFWQYRKSSPAAEIQLTGPGGPTPPAQSKKISL